jgi:hypothetical protein
MRPRRSLTLLAAAPLVLAFSPVTTVDGALDDATSAVVDVGTGVTEIVDAHEDDTFTSPNVTPVGLVPGASAVSTVFATDAPIMYSSTLTGIRTYDISDPTLPRLLGCCRWPSSRTRTSSWGSGPTAPSSCSSAST